VVNDPLHVLLQDDHPHESRTTSTTRLVYSGRVCLGKEGAASFFK
jgi:hypothetical protein